MNTKEKLIHSAIKLFSDKWFETTSTTSICSDAGFSSAALFVHFKTKNDLLDHIYMCIKKENFLYANTWLKKYTDVFETAGDIMLQGAQYYKKNPEKFFFMKRFMNSSHISRIAHSEIEKEMQGMQTLLNIGKAEEKVIALENDLIYQIIAGAIYNLIEYAIETDMEIELKHIRIVLSMIEK